MIRKKSLVPFLATLALGIAFVLSPMLSAAEKPKELEGIGITEHLGSTVGISDLSFQDDQGKPVVLGNYFNKHRPVILALVYFECPNLCNLLLNGLLDSLRKLDWTTGNQFDLIAVSINPKETSQLASRKKANYLKIYNRSGAEEGWHFLTGEENQIRSLASQVGFQYRYDEKEKQYLHASALYILTPQGKISRYLYGLSFPTKDLKFSLMDAANEKIGTMVDQILLFCFHFDPNKNSYTLHMWRIVQIFMSLQVVGMGSLLYLMWKKYEKNKKVVN
ncbi:MAG: SCO family protein [Bdellovibrionia bacterium]